MVGQGLQGTLMGDVGSLVNAIFERVWVLCVSALIGAVPCMAQEVSPAPGNLSLQQAIDRAIAEHPELKLVDFSELQFRANADLVVQAPPLAVELDVENINDDADDIAEVTLSLASTLERGGKRDARVAYAQQQLSALGVAREKARLDLMAEVARRYLEVAHAQAQVELSRADIAHRVRTVEAASQRVRAGASPESVQLTAEAAQARAQLEHDRAERERVSAYRRLALLWNDRTPTVQSVTGNLTALPNIPDAQALAAMIERSPELKQFADAQRLREARLRLAKTARSSDILWRVGVRRLEETDEWAAVGSVSIPFGSARRADPEIRSAQAELDALSVERQSSELTLFATLVEAHGHYLAAQAEVHQWRTHLLPRLTRAEASAERAYRAGALSYLEWAQVQGETTEARQRELDAALEAQRALIELQRLTGEPMIVPSTAP